MIKHQFPLKEIHGQSFDNTRVRKMNQVPINGNVCHMGALDEIQTAVKHFQKLKLKNIDIMKLLTYIYKCIFIDKLY